MTNHRLEKGHYVQSISVTLRLKDLKVLDKMSKNFKNRSEAIRFLIEKSCTERQKSIKIKADDLNNMYRFEKYIKEKCLIARQVYCNSIYFSETSKKSDKWCYIWPDYMDSAHVISHINALCGTEFELEK